MSDPFAEVLGYHDRLPLAVTPLASMPDDAQLAHWQDHNLRVLAAAALGGVGEEVRVLGLFRGAGLDQDHVQRGQAGAFDVPITRMFGQSSTGLGANGEENTRNYYDNVASRQKLEIKPAMSVLATPV